MTNDELPAVRLRAVRKVYGAGSAAVTALDGVSVDFGRGSYVAVMGPSGSGKSTLLLCAAGLERPDAGDVLLATRPTEPPHRDGGWSLDWRRRAPVERPLAQASPRAPQPGGVSSPEVAPLSGGPERLGDEPAQLERINGLSEKQLTLLRRDRIGFVFQAFNLLPSLNAELNVALSLLLAGRRPARRDTVAMLAAVGLADRAGHRPAQLSGGQQQRVAVARALMTRPEVLFADEPTGNLDSASGRAVLGLLRSLVDERGQTVIMVTHDPVAASYSDRVVFLRDGRLAGELAGPTPQTVAERMTALEVGR